jgi:single-strand DNA-binding protein
MAGVNKVILVGRLGSDPEVRNLESGSVVANFNIATSEKYKNKSGELVEQTEWHRLELWDNQAKVAQQYLKKGDQVYVEGKLRTEEYTDKDGISRRSTKVRVTTLTLLGGGKSGEKSEESNYSAPSGAVTSPNIANEPIGDSVDDDLPF